MRVFGNVTPGDATLTVYDINGRHFAVPVEGGQWETPLPADVYRFVFEHPDCKTVELTGRVQGHHNGEQHFPDQIMEYVDGRQKYTWTVKNQKDEPVESAQIQVFPPNSDQIIAEGFTDAFGKFEVFLKPEEYEAFVYKPGFNKNQPMKVQ